MHISAITVSKKIKKMEIVNSYYPNLKYINKSVFKTLAPFLNKKTIVLGWGYQEETEDLFKLSKKNNLNFHRLEDGFIKSYISGEEDSLSHSIVMDKKGMYYNTSSENDFKELCLKVPFKKKSEEEVSEIINRIIVNSVSKYNKEKNKSSLEVKGKNVLLISQVKGDSSLKFGKVEDISTEDILKDIKEREGTNTNIYVKIHPGSLLEGKESSIDLDKCKEAGCLFIEGEYDNFNLLKKFDAIYTKTSQLGFESLLLGKPTYVYGIPYYSQYGLTNDLNKEAKLIKNLTKEELFYFAYIEYSFYYSHLDKRTTDIDKSLDSIIFYKNHLNKIDKDLILLDFKDKDKSFIRGLTQSYRALKRAFIKSKDFLGTSTDLLVSYENKTNLSRNSITVSKGVLEDIEVSKEEKENYSMIFDELGIYYDPEKKSGFEKILLNKKGLSSYEDKRIINLVEKIKENQISIKSKLKASKLALKKQAYKKYILIPGQIEEDISIKAGGLGMNMSKLIENVRSKNIDSFIIYKPHEDVLSGKEKGISEHSDCDYIAYTESIESLMDIADEVHVLTSIVGFDALLNGKATYVYGHPFYCGWGLTKDLSNAPMRRTAKTLNELAYSFYIDYATYYYNGSYRTPEYVLNVMLHKKRFKKNKVKSIVKLKNNILKIISYK